MTWAQAEAVIADGPVDVVLAHDAPDRVMIPGINEHTAKFWPEHLIREANQHRALMGNVADALQPSLWVHGHYHVRYEGRRLDSPTRVVGLAHDGEYADKNIWMQHLPE